MASVVVVYASKHGYTRSMANTLAVGALSVPSTTVLLRVADEATEADVLGADALVLGTPVHMGGLDWSMKRFIDSVCGPLWLRDALVGRIGAAFVTGGGFGGAGAGCELTILSLLTNLAECGLILVPLPKTTPGFNLGGMQWGPYVRTASDTMERTGVPDGRLESAFHHGVHIARLANALAGHQMFAHTA